ncbi:hypothetical protein POM88_027503 [Heracleum sosnowskyi]|uniref:NTF2 domain-containing protein n=1 Tax=Heracleum sosnowskyi TaxID=360622 RepID=A0AAD8I938_9APIA|nr:hypothetical protein POM88_027503 [Heracleum sosnowskyi]
MGVNLITSVDAQESPNMDVHILVTGFGTGRDNIVRNFAQSFLLGQMENGRDKYLLHDMFGYVGNVNRLYMCQSGCSQRLSKAFLIYLLFFTVVGVPGQVKVAVATKK